MTTLLRKPAAAWIATLTMLLAACTFTQTKSFDQQLAVAYSVHTAVLDAAADGVNSGVISVADGLTVLKIADQAKLLLDSARAAESLGDNKSATEKLTLAVEVLQNLQTFVEK